jgi:hypothetical protein
LFQHDRSSSRTPRLDDAGTLLNGVTEFAEVLSVAEACEKLLAA